MDIRAACSILAVAAYACGALAPAAASAQDTPVIAPREIAARARQSVVLITAYRGGREISQGSGFFVQADGGLVTNHHVVVGADRIEITTSTGEMYDRVWLVSHDERRDLVILRIAGVRFPILPLGDDHQAEVGDPVYVMGNPLGLDGTFSDGLVSAKRTVDGISYIQISAPISPGSSGGPVLNDRGEVIGIATLTVEDGQNLNLAVPVRYAHGLIALAEPPVPWEQAWSALAMAGEPVGGHEGGAEEPLEAWAQVLLDEMAAMDDAAARIGAVEVFDPVIEMLKQGDTHVIEYEFDVPGARIALVGVCDIDCTDLDLGVFDAYGQEIAVDIEADDRPEVNIEIYEPGVLEVHVYMAACSVQPCGFAVQAYQLAPGGETAPAKKN